MIIDCFMFFNELDMLEGRLEYLYDTVDYFVIVENDLTHNGNKKPMNYANNVARYRKFQKKIIYLPLSTDHSKYDWNRIPPVGILDITTYYASMAMDVDQRNYIAQGLKQFKPTDIVMISDLDEIPTKKAIKQAIQHINSGVTAVAFVQDMFYYNLKQKQTNLWAGTIMTTNRSVTEKSPQWFRRKRWDLTRIMDAGWHLSYWMTPEQIQHKIMNFAHQEYNIPEFTDLDKIAERIKNGKDLFGRETSTTSPTEFIPVDRHTLNQELLAVFEKYEPKFISHFYNSVEGWFSQGDISFYKESLDKFSGPAHFVEIGSYKGRSSSYMATAIANSGKSIKFDCVDTWLGSPEHQKGGSIEDPDVVNDTMFDVFTQNMEPVKKYYTAVRMTSVEAAATYADNSLDFVFIDADHKYESVREDIVAWWPKVKNNGIISGHDYHIGAPGVMQATNELFGFVRVTANCWWVEKKLG